MSQQFKELTGTVQNALSEFQPPNKLDLQGLVKDVLLLDTWAAMARSEDLSNSGQLSFPKWMVPEVFPTITSSLFMVCVHWMMGHQPDDLSGWINHVPISRTKWSVQWWLGYIPDQVIELCSQFPEFLQLHDPFAINGEPALTSQWLINYSHVSPLIMVILISPLVLLLNTTLTNPMMLPTMNTLLLHATLCGGFIQISQGDLDAFHVAWRVVLPHIPESVDRTPSPPLDNTDNEGPSTSTHTDERPSTQTNAKPSTSTHTDKGPSTQTMPSFHFCSH
ncbi:uncharacterized protein EI90DRAFT_3121039 [Cantharellus anzutake]|uniref:uncharacterized protein n=1 Tax=Cantharellus anzutake TaxID=1750568 RepID=UPI001908407E|nr:uncharacterized protein EI90DRAFT_3121039 [Cantharellus anzutake]KAF8334618.1 hypothetical protein EI90DRAFT_3121039 [Cantharellus anzutake]